MRYNIYKNLVVTILLFAICTGCVENDYRTVYDNVDLSQYRIIHLSNGETLKVPKEINRYASLSPSYTETLIDLGFQDDIVIIDNNSTYLEGLDNVTGVIDLDRVVYNITPIIENLAEVILMSSETYNKLTSEDFAMLKKHNCTIIKLDKPKTVEEVRNELEFFVELTQAPQGEKMLKNFDTKYERILEAHSNVDDFIPVFLQLYDYGSDNIITKGGDDYLNEMIRLAGGENIFRNNKGLIYTSLEEVGNRQPEVIIIVYNGDEMIERNLYNNVNLKDSPAVKNQQIYVLDDSQMYNPNYRSMYAILTIGYILHRDLYE